jgi:hypothetical protein
MPPTMQSYRSYDTTTKRHKYASEYITNVSEENSSRANFLTEDRQANI